MRWYAAHVFLLPAMLDRLYGGARLPDAPPRHLGPHQGRAGRRPSRSIRITRCKDTIAIAVVFGLLLTLAIAFDAPLDAVADPTDATYVPRPEWYFMSLFELLKHFPGPLEPVATMVIPGRRRHAAVPAAVSRSPARPRAGKRPLVIGSFVFVFAGITFLTVLGFRSTPLRRPPRNGRRPGWARRPASAGP